MAQVRITKLSPIETAPMGSNLIVVRIDTNQSGLYGYGCATYTQRHKAVVTAIEEYMNQLLVGRDALNVNDAWSVMMNSSYWRNGPVLNNAISGCDMALSGVRSFIPPDEVIDSLAHSQEKLFRGPIRELSNTEGIGAAWTPTAKASVKRSQELCADILLPEKKW